MENNNQPTNGQTSQTQQQPTAFPNVTQADQPLSAGPDPNSSKKTSVYWIAAFMITAVLVLAGAFLYFGMPKPNQNIQVQAPQPKTEEQMLEQELESLDVESNESDFAEVDKDLQNL